MESILLNESQVFAAFRLLFASDVRNCKEVLESIRQAEVKQAYRKKALQTHPDRFAAHGEAYQKRCSERFIQVNNAYEIINAYLESRDNGFINFKGNNGANGSAAANQQSRWRQRPPETHQRDRAGGPFAQTFWEKDVPRRYLRFGEFLYYSKVIPWNLLVRGLVWQSKNRPRLGEIAQGWRWLTELQIKSLLDRRHPGERLGELLLNHHLISPFQLKVLLRQQQKLQKPIGEYFVQEGLVNEGQIPSLLRRQQSHNILCRSGRPAH